MEAQPWDRQAGEPLIWYRRFTALRLMSPTRSIAAVYQQESKKDEKVRSNAPGRWYETAHQFHWQERAQAWDEHQSKELEATIAAEKQKVLSEGYALMHERVKTLNILAKKLVADIAKGKMYRVDVRSIGTGKDARQVNVELFEEGPIRELRACLDDIAKELGERVKRTQQEITGANGKPLIPDHDEILGALSDEEFEQLKMLQSQALARLEQQHDSGK
jgi:hypothetical protein